LWCIVIFKNSILGILSERSVIFVLSKNISKGIAQGVLEIDFGLHKFYYAQLQYKLSLLRIKSSKSQFYKKQVFLIKIF